MIWKLLPSYDDKKRWGLIFFAIIGIPMFFMVVCLYPLIAIDFHDETKELAIRIMIIIAMIMLIVLVAFIYLRCECKERLYRHLEGNAGLYQDVYSLAPDDFLEKQFAIVSFRLIGATFISETERGRCEAIMMVRRIRQRDEHKTNEEDSSIENDRE